MIITDSLICSSDASFEVELKRKVDGWINLRYEWMEGSLGKLLSYLSKFGVKDKVIIRLVWRQERSPADESTRVKAIEGDDNDWLTANVDFVL